MGRSNIDIGRNGNIYHIRSGEILKKWVTKNSFTGEGHFIESSKSEDIEDSYEWRKKIIAKAKKQYSCKDCKNQVKLRSGGFWCYENYLGEKRWPHIQAYAQAKGLCFLSDTPDRKMHAKKTKNGNKIYPKHCELFKKKGKM